MGPAATARAARSSRRTGTELTNCVDSKLKVLADKTNHMALRSSRRSMASPQPKLGCEQKSCVYKAGSTAENQDMPPEERLAMYTFKADEYDPQPKKSRHKRNVRHRKKTDTVDDEYTPTINVKKYLRPGTSCIVTRQKKYLSTGVTCYGEVALESKDVGAVTGSSLKCLNTDVSHDKLTLWKEDTGSVTSSNVKCLSPGVAYCESGSHQKTATENKENIAVVNTISTCQVASVTHNKPRNLMSENKAVISAAAADMCVNVHQKPDVCSDLAYNSELNFSVVESEPGQVSPSCRSSLLISPVVRRFSQCVTVQRPGKCRDSHCIQSVEDFTVENYFGFDEESEDDLHFSVSQVETAPSLKPVMSVPFAISSTPNPKPSFTRPEIKPVRLVKAGTRTRTTHSSVRSATVPSAASVSTPKLLLASNTTLPDAVNTADSPCPSVIYTDEDVPLQHFTKPARRSYERLPRSYQESHSDDSLSDDETCSRKRYKRTKKARMQEQKTLEKWAANVSAEFDEIDSFKLCVE